MNTWEKIELDKRAPIHFPEDNKIAISLDANLINLEQKHLPIVMLKALRQFRFNIAKVTVDIITFLSNKELISRLINEIIER